MSDNKIKKDDIINDGLKAIDSKLKIIVDAFSNWRIKHSACEIRKTIWEVNGRVDYQCLSCNEVFIFNKKEIKK